MNDSVDLNTLLNSYKPNDKVAIVFERLGVNKETLLTFQANSTYHLGLFETNNLELREDSGSTPPPPPPLCAPNDL